MKKSFVAPLNVSREAQKGLILWNEHGRKCATSIGVTRAHQLANRKQISIDIVKRMWKFFNRHQKNRKNGPPRCGKTSWLLWGGDAGYKWATKVLLSEGYLEKVRR